MARLTSAASFFLLVLSLAAPGARAQHAGHGSVTHGTAAPSAMPGSMMESMDRMSRTMMAVPMTGNADRDFAAMMIPHHQGAIDMARYQIAHGKDPALRRMAEEVIVAQEKEITVMRTWLAQHPAR